MELDKEPPLGGDGLLECLSVKFLKGNRCHIRHTLKTWSQVKRVNICGLRLILETVIAWLVSTRS